MIVVVLLIASPRYPILLVCAFSYLFHSVSPADDLVFVAGDFEALSSGFEADNGDVRQAFLADGLRAARTHTTVR